MSDLEYEAATLPVIMAGIERRMADEFVFRSINAWNAMRQGRELRILRGAQGESPSYPKIM